jgi:hypothetical protein
MEKEIIKLEEVNILNLIKKGMSYHQWNELNDEEKEGYVMDFLRDRCEKYDLNDDGTYNIYINGDYMTERHNFNLNTFRVFDFGGEKLVTKNDDPVFIGDMYDVGGEHFEDSLLIIYGREDVIVYNLLNDDVVKVNTRGW